MVMLTEEMVIARTKQSNLAAITKLNCWGSQLSDVTILRRMPNVTVLSLSVNNIHTLADFQYCKKLQDLFVRKNSIKDINEICYLQDLPNLKSLWIDENPCVEKHTDESFRLSVIRALPQLKKLDDTVIEPTELERAQRFGKVLVHPEQQEEYYSDQEDDSVQQVNYTEERQEEGTPRYSYQQQQQDSTHCNEPERSTPETQYRQQEHPQSHIQHEVRNKSELETNSENNTKQVTETIKDPEVLTRSSSFKSEDHMDIYSPPVNMRGGGGGQYSSIPRSRTTDGELAYCNDYRRFSRTCLNSCSGSRRPVDRKTNVLNAVLCLIKELDFHNLEVVEMAVKCRMDELEG